jgi:chaperonin GroL
VEKSYAFYIPVSTSSAVRPCLSMINYGIICTLFIITIVLAPQAQAQHTVARRIVLQTQVPFTASQVDDLIRQLQSQDVKVRSEAASTLVLIGPKAKDAVPALIAALKDQHANVRSPAAAALGGIGPKAKDAVPALIATLQDQDEHVRSAAADALGGIGPDAKDAVPTLIAALKDQNAYVRRSAAGALFRIGPDAKDAVPTLIAALEDKGQHPNVRVAAASALGGIGPDAKDAVPVLIAVLKDEGLHAFIRSSAAGSLGRIGLEAKDAMPALIVALKDQEVDVCRSAADALGRLATVSFDTRSRGMLPQLKEAYEEMKNHSDRDIQDDADKVRRMINALESITPSPMASFQSWIINHPYLSSALGFFTTYFLLLPVAWSCLLWLRPLWLLSASKFLSQFELKVKLPIEFSISSRQFLLISLFHYRSRVLNAWVERNIGIAKEAFEQIYSVTQRKMYIPIPVEIRELESGKVITEPGPNDFRSYFNSKRAVIVITGGGGTGKSTLACQLGLWALERQVKDRLHDHRMIPLFIEEETDDLFATVLGHLTQMIGADEVSEEIVKHLLKQRYLLIIVDALSERTTKTQRHIETIHGKLAINSMIITTRLKSDLGPVPYIQVQPQKLGVNTTLFFLTEYLRRTIIAESFTGNKQEAIEIFSARQQLQLSELLLALVESGVNHLAVTPLLIKIFVDNAINIFLTHGSFRELPASVPETLLEYLRRVNPQGIETPNRLGNDKMIFAVRLLAPCSLGTDYIPREFYRDEAEAALKEAGMSEENVDIISRLVTNGVIIERSVAGTKILRFVLDPLSEYLAALYWLDRLRSDKTRWDDWLQYLTTITGFPSSITGFLIALEDCITTYRASFKIPLLQLPWPTASLIASEGPREIVIHGLRSVAKRIAAAFGPAGTRISVPSNNRQSIPSKRGLTIAQSTNATVPLEQIGIQEMRTASQEMIDSIGDGVKTVMLLVSAMIDSGNNALKRGYPANELTRGMEKAVRLVLKELSSHANPVRGGDILRIATTAASDRALGSIVEEAFKKVGKYGMISVENGDTTNTTLTIERGYRFDCGYLASDFITDYATGQCVLEDCYILVSERRFTSHDSIIPILQKVLKTGRPLLVIAEDVEGTALDTMVINKVREVLSCAAVKAPGYGDSRRAYVEDIAIYSGGRAFTKNVGVALENIKLEDLGRVERVVIDKHNTTMFSEAKTRQQIEGRVKNLRQELDQTSEQYDKAKLEYRLAKLAEAVGTIQVGGGSSSEVIDKRYRIDSGIHSCQVGIEGGWLPGGGLSFLKAKRALDQEEFKDGPEAVGKQVIAYALEEPIRALIKTVHMNDTALIAEIEESGYPDIGFNVESKGVENLVEVGVLDPCLTLCKALEIALSHARTILQTSEWDISKPFEPTKSEEIKPEEIEEV